MRAASLVAVLVLARIFGLAGRDLPLSVWLPSALIWHDVVVGLAFWLCHRWLGWSWPVRALYWGIVVFAAVNVAIVRALSSPLTVPMLRATGGALGDSIVYYATPANVAMVALVVVAGAALPRLAVPARVGRAVVAATLAVAIPGPFVESRLDIRGAQRNSVSALVLTALPRISPPVGAVDGDWRASPFPSSPEEDLHWLQGAAAGRDVVMIVLESTGARYLRTYGAADDPMPALTALTLEAVQFDAAYAVYPESIKGLFAVLCSRHPGFDVSVDSHAAAPCTPLAGTMAARAGYQSALFHSGRFGYLGMEDVLARQGFDTLEDAGAIGGQVESSFGVDEPSTVARILSWIDARDRDRPFFVAYLPVAGHHPYATPEPGPFSGEGELSAYKNALRYGDDSIAVLFDGLRSRGLYERTLIVIFGDHGEAFGQHDGNYGHTLYAFDENVRVPLVVSVPGVTTRAIRSRRVASVVDVAPTILGLIGAPVPAAYEGSSLLHGPDRLAYVFTDYALGWVGLRDGCWKYLLEIEAGRSSLFDVCRDPDERHDRGGAHATRVEAYRDRALAWIGATRQAYRD